MAFKLIVALTFFAVVSAGVLPAYQEYHAQPSYGKSEESYDHHPKYEFSYSVHDEHTGDIKSQVEARDGDLVKGEYSLIDSDGHKRIVQYTADHDHGFNAIVHREPVDLKSIAPGLLEYASGPAHHYEHAPAYTQQIVKSVPVALEAAPAHSYHHH